MRTILFELGTFHRSRASCLLNLSGILASNPFRILAACLRDRLLRYPIYPIFQINDTRFAKNAKPKFYHDNISIGSVESPRPALR